MSLAAAILDVDGVLTHTAAQHERAWKRLFDAELRRRGDPRLFTHDDYLEHNPTRNRPLLSSMRYRPKW